MSTQEKNPTRHAGLLLSGAIFLGGAIWMYTAAAASKGGVAIPAAAQTASQTPIDGTRTAVLAGGCFWGMESVFEHVDGVTDVVSGYAGGTEEHANYRDSSSGRYDDAEAVRISYDPEQISYADLLQIYFSVAHDPTQVNRQGPDRGPQYRSEIFAANPAQAEVANAYIEQLTQADVFSRPIATKVSVGEHFFPAESYHQNYADLHPNSMYIRINDAPKVEALKSRFGQRYRERPANLAANG
ncbi:peptide-methionine (S)-S-oxide reductase MsrA [Salinisphaera aquimarina]|uniref:Peptide methionine sulfoxide reductase MsrA n=1 Tax=Salinisphaera aquimarina TaxID=2094031 RepID=A0ABV7EX64_9GAMM